MASAKGLVRLRPVDLALRPALHTRRLAVVILGIGTLATVASVLVFRPHGELTTAAATLTVIGVAVIAGIVFTEGVVSRDLHTGAALLWLQKPIRPELYYLGRFAESLLGALLFVLAMASAVAGLVAAASDTDVDRLLVVVPAALVATIVYGSLTFAFSGLGVRRDGIGPVAITLFAVVPVSQYSLDPGHFSSFWKALEVVLPPGRAWLQLLSFLLGHPAPDLPASLAWIAAYCAVTMAIGVGGVAWTMRSPFTRGEIG